MLAHCSAGMARPRRGSACDSSQFSSRERVGREHGAAGRRRVTAVLDAKAVSALRSDGVFSLDGAWLDNPARRQHDGAAIPKPSARRR